CFRPHYERGGNWAANGQCVDPPPATPPLLQVVRLTRCNRGGLAQPWAGVEAEIDAAADRVPFGRERDGLADCVQVTPAFGEVAVALERCAAPVPVRQIHRLTRAVGGVARGHAAAGALL